MKTSALLKLHQRQVDVLDMIIKADNNKKGFERDGYIFRSKSDSRYFGDYGVHLNKMVERYAAIKQRLIRYYLDIQERINALQPKIEIEECEANLIIQNQNQPT